MKSRSNAQQVRAAFFSTLREMFAASPRAQSRGEELGVVLRLPVAEAVAAAARDPACIDAVVPSFEGVDRAHLAQSLSLKLGLAEEQFDAVDFDRVFRCEGPVAGRDAKVAITALLVLALLDVVQRNEP